MSAEASEDLNPVSGQEETPQSTAEQPGESESAGEEALDQLSEDGGTLEEGEAEEEEVIFDDSTHQLWGHGGESGGSRGEASTSRLCPGLQLVG